jgi:NDP-sugar pyrophosphorylase family protein
MQRRAIILAGGKGTRLRPFTLSLPKPLVPVNERPILDIILTQLKRSGFGHVTIAVNHFAALIEAFCGDGTRWGLNIDYSREQAPLGTIGPLSLVEDVPDNFLVMNGDVLTDVNFDRLIDQHQDSRCMLTIAACRRHHPIEFGVLTVGSDSRLVAFDEKPQLSHLVNMGVYGVHRSLIERIPRDRAVGVDEIVHGLLNAGDSIQVVEHTGFWFDLGKADDFERAQEAGAILIGDKQT